MVYIHVTSDSAGLIEQGIQTSMAEVVCRAAALQSYAATAAETRKAAKIVIAVARAWDSH